MNKYVINGMLLIIVITTTNILSANIANSIKNLQEDTFGQNYLVNPFIGVDIYFDKKLNLKNEVIEFTNVSYKLPDLPLNEIFTLNKGEFVQIQTNDGIKNLFDGSIIIKFNTVPDFDNYAISKEIEFLTDLSDIKRGIFKINNLFDLQIKIDEIILDENVLEIELNLRDPRLKVQ